MNTERARELLHTRRIELEQLRTGLDVADRDEQEDLGSLSSADQHPADIATETFGREVDFSLLEQIRSELRDLEIAEQRLETGEYGVCEICHQPIPDERLESMPETRRCREHSNVVFGTIPHGRTE